MKFINNGEAKQVRIKEGTNRFRWELVKTGDIINLSRDIGFNYGFKEAKEEVEENDDIKATEGNIGDTKVETKQIDHSEKQNEKSYSEKLSEINGIGKKTAEDIIKVFPTEEELLKAISKDDELPFRDDVEEKLRKDYGK